MLDKNKFKITLFGLLSFSQKKWILIAAFAILLGSCCPNNIAKALNKTDKGIQIINIHNSHYKGYLILVKDPKKITVGVTPHLYNKGATLSEIIKSSNAEGGMNAGGFVDNNLTGNGGVPVGILINNNKIMYKQNGIKKFSVIGFNKRNLLVVSNNMTLNQIKANNIRDAVSFGPVLVLNGKPAPFTGGGSFQPRSVIGQRKDGTVLLLAIDGRQKGSEGATYKEVQSEMLKYGAINAANLDGGSSTTLIYQGETINNPSDILGERSLSTAFIILGDTINSKNNQSSTGALSNQNNAEKVSKIPKGASELSISCDNKYCMYLNNGFIYLQQIGSDKIIKRISESSKITKAILMKDRNIVIYFAIEKGMTSKSDNVRIMTYNIDKDERTVQLFFTMDKGAAIKDVQYSSLTNLIMVNTEMKKKNRISDRVYCINIMNRVRTLVTGRSVKNMVLLNKTSDLYYQDSNGILFRNSNKMKVFGNEKLHILGKDSYDNIYVQSLSKRSVIYVLNSGKIINTLQLGDINYIKILNNGENIYIVYKGFFINLTSNIRKRINYNSSFNLFDIVDNRIYMTDNNRLRIDIISNNL